MIPAAGACRAHGGVSRRVLGEEREDRGPVTRRVGPPTSRGRPSRPTPATRRRQHQGRCQQEEPPAARAQERGRADQQDEDREAEDHDQVEGQDQRDRVGGVLRPGLQCERAQHQAPPDVGVRVDYVDDDRVEEGARRRRAGERRTCRNPAPLEERHHGEGEQDHAAGAAQHALEASGHPVQDREHEHGDRDVAENGCKGGGKRAPPPRRRHPGEQERLQRARLDRGREGEAAADDDVLQHRESPCALTARA